MGFVPEEEGGVKIHTLYDIETQIPTFFHITPARLPSGVLSDAIGYMDGQLTMSKYPEKIRRIIYLDSESDRKFIFFTNALDINSLKVAELYHNRWHIELFFKWLKQHLKIKKFWGETENAVRIQIYTAITTYCMIGGIGFPSCRHTAHKMGRCGRCGNGEMKKPMCFLETHRLWFGLKLRLLVQCAVYVCPYFIFGCYCVIFRISAQG